MSVFELKTFDVVKMRSFKRLRRNEIVQSEVTFKAKKNRVFALLLLDEVEIGAAVDGEALLNAAGWFFDAERARSVAAPTETRE